MSGSKTSVMSSKQMVADRKRNKSATDWDRVRREATADQPPARDADAPNAVRQIRSAARTIGRPVSGEEKTALSLRVPNSTLARWKATGPGWQTRMVRALEKAE